MGPRPHPVPRGWKACVRSAVLQVMSLARYSLASSWARAGDSPRTLPRLRARIDRLEWELALRNEELRIKDARLAQLPPQRRPHYPPTERMAILELKAVRGWSLAETAKAFLISSVTIATWMKRLDEQGPVALVQIAVPVNRFPEFVGYLVQRLRVLCPTMGKRKIAEMLARAGLHLGTTTIGRILKQKPKPQPEEAIVKTEPAIRRVTAKRSNHVWHVDLTTVPISGGFWVPWVPFALPQCWPCCWWVAVILDHYSRRVLGTAEFRGQPSSEQVRAFLGRTIHAVGSAPKHLICDRGCQFDSDGFRRYCRKKGIKPRYGAVGKHGSLAVVERLILTLKQCCALWPLVPLCKRNFQRELSLVTEWYNGSRPHTTLNGATPDERYFGRFPACRKPRYEPRARWPRGSPCAVPWALMRRSPGARLELEVEFHRGRRHLPVVTVRLAA